MGGRTKFRKYSKKNIILRATKDGKLWRALIVNIVNEQGTSKMMIIKKCYFKNIKSFILILLPTFSTYSLQII